MKHIFQQLDTNGDGTGTTSAVGNYAVTPEEFYIKPPAVEIYQIHRMITMVRDTGSFDAGQYGNGIALTNGITLAVERDGAEYVALTGDMPIKVNSHWGAHCYDADLKSWGAGDNFLLVRWTFEKAGSPLVLYGASSDRLVLTLNDDFTGLVDHRFTVQGTTNTQ